MLPGVSFRAVAIPSDPSTALPTGQRTLRPLPGPWRQAGLKAARDAVKLAVDPDESARYSTVIG